MRILLPDSPNEALSEEASALAKVLLEHAVLTSAEKHEVAPRVLRAAVIAVLDATERAQVSVKTARALLAPRAAVK